MARYGRKRRDVVGAGLVDGSVMYHVPSAKAMRRDSITACR